MFSRLCRCCGGTYRIICPVSNDEASCLATCLAPVSRSVGNQERRLSVAEMARLEGAVSNLGIEGPSNHLADDVQHLAVAIVSNRPTTRVWLHRLAFWINVIARRVRRAWSTHRRSSAR
jgi:hypothetical protein